VVFCCAVSGLIRRAAATALLVCRSCRVVPSKFVAGTAGSGAAPARRHQVTNAAQSLAYSRSVSCAGERRGRGAAGGTSTAVRSAVAWCASAFMSLPCRSRLSRPWPLGRPAGLVTQNRAILATPNSASTGFGRMIPAELPIRRIGATPRPRPSRAVQRIRRVRSLMDLPDYPVNRVKIITRYRISPPLALKTGYFQ
jgi:hypothetical protein